MTLVEIRQRQQSAPFRPFRLHLADGRSLEVSHPEYLTVFNKAPRIVVERDDGSYALVNLPIVTSVEVLAPRKAKSRA